MSEIKLLVFGATGAVGKACATEAHRRGAKVTLAMRDPSKGIDGLSDLPKVKADLTDASSVKDAVKQCGAKVAFVYTMDDMDATFEALKASGIEYVVLLSSWTIYPNDIYKGAESHAIPAKHAKAEIALEKVGLKFSAIRALYFASNTTYESANIQKGEVNVLNPDGVWDYIAPEDIGLVAAGKVFSDPEVVPIMGAALISQREAWKIIGAELGRDIKIKELSYDEFVGNSGVPNEFATSLALGTIVPDDVKYPPERCEVALQNVKKYGGREPTSFKDWVKAHREDFLR